MIVMPCQKDLRLPLQPPKRHRLDNPMSIQLERKAQWIVGLIVLTPDAPCGRCCPQRRIGFVRLYHRGFPDASLQTLLHRRAGEEADRSRNPLTNTE
jgi:hypothetical protein